MKKSRTGKAFLFLICIVVLFAVVMGIISARSDKSSDDGGLAGLFAGDNKIRVVQIEGPITSSDATLKQLRKFRKKKSVKAILLRINSPGGSVAPAQEIYTEVGRTRLTKPVVVSMETLGTSAAYISQATRTRYTVLVVDHRQHRRYYGHDGLPQDYRENRIRRQRH